MTLVKCCIRYAQQASIQVSPGVKFVCVVNASVKSRIWFAVAGRLGLL